MSHSIELVHCCTDGQYHHADAVMLDRCGVLQPPQRTNANLLPEPRPHGMAVPVEAPAPHATGEFLTPILVREQNFGRLLKGSIMMSGTVKWFNDAKGFGFIEPDGGGADVFAHFSAVQMDGFRTLKQGGRVSYELVQGPKGSLAQNIRSLGGEVAPLVPAQQAPAAAAAA